MLSRDGCKSLSTNSSISIRNFLLRFYKAIENYTSYGFVESQKKFPYTYGRVCYETSGTFDEKVTRNNTCKIKMRRTKKGCDEQKRCVRKICLDGNVSRSAQDWTSSVIPIIHLFIFAHSILHPSIQINLYNYIINHHTLHLW